MKYMTEWQLTELQACEERKDKNMNINGSKMDDKMLESVIGGATQDVPAYNVNSFLQYLSDNKKVITEHYAADGTKAAIVSYLLEQASKTTIEDSNVLIQYIDNNIESLNDGSDVYSNIAIALNAAIKGS